MDDYEKDLRRRIAAQERGTWRAELRNRYGPWFDELDYGFAVGDGWAELLADLTAEIASIVGGPEAAPRLRVRQVKEKFGRLRVDLQGRPPRHAAALEAALRRAEGRSGQICEACGRPGRLRICREGIWHTACEAHALD